MMRAFAKISVTVRENGAASGVGVLATYQYDSLSRRASQTFGNGVVQNTNYDPVTRLATQVTDLAATANDLTQTFAYNPASQITSVTRSNDLYAWTGHYNQNDPSTANGLNQVTNAGAKAITHDNRGNITAVGAQTYAYTSENLLSAASGGVTLYYDHLMRLVEYDTNISTRYVYDSAAIAAEVDGPGAIQHRYVRGDGIDEVLVDYVGGGTTSRRFLSSDERGSIIATTDSNGALLGLNKYDEYGVPQSTNLGKFGYTGQTWLPEVGLWYYKARFYRPDIGRFMQTDPIGYEAGPNLYAYVGNDPVNWTDPLGLQDCANVDGNGNCDDPIEVWNTRNPCTTVIGCSSYTSISPFGISVVNATFSFNGGNSRNSQTACMTPAAAVPPNAAARGVTGDTYGQDPTMGSSIMNSNLPGSDSWLRAFIEFTIITTRVGDFGGVQINPAPTVLIKSLPSGIQLRSKSGPDSRFRIDIPPNQGPGNLNVRESVKVGDKPEENQCPIQ